VADDQKPNEGQQETQFGSSGVSEALLRRIAIAVEAQSKTAEQKPQNGAEPAKPLFVQVVGGDDLEPFEEQSLAISRETLTLSSRTYHIAFYAFIAAVAAAAFVFMQVKEMSYQTQIMAAQSESAAAGAAIGELNTRRQLEIAQQQATAAQDGAKAIQRQTIQELRPWIKFSMGDPKVSPTISWYVEVGSPLTAPVMFTNVGKTPAINVIVMVGIDIISRGKDPKLPVAFRSPRGPTPPMHFVRGAIRELKTGTIFPQGNVHNMVERLELKNGKAVKKVATPDEAKAVNEGNAYLVIFGQAKYFDGFGIERWTRFCKGGFANGEDANSGKCAKYNAVDNN
jgi:hypothetical protein